MTDGYTETLNELNNSLDHIILYSKATTQEVADALTDLAADFRKFAADEPGAKESDLASA